MAKISINELLSYDVMAPTKDKKRWTISNDSKIPIALKRTLNDKMVRYAKTNVDYETITELEQMCPKEPHNLTYKLNYLEDGFMVLDIEKQCDESLKKKLLQLPFDYGEKSTSGLGYHLIFKTPKNIIEKHSELLKKARLKSKNKDYEVLLHHHVIFTRDEITKEEVYDPTIEAGSFEDLLKDLIKDEKVKNKRNIKVNKIDIANIPNVDIITRKLLEVDYLKTPSDFKDDMSDYEFGHMGKLYFVLKNITNIGFIKAKHKYSDEELANILYSVALEKIPYREKHDTYRENKPWLLYLAKEIISLDDPVYREQKERKKQKKKKKH